MTSINIQTVERYLDGFRKTDHEGIVSCLTDDVVWELPGAFRLEGKDAFDKEIENDAFEGRPAITVKGIVEVNDVVTADLEIRSAKKGGAPFFAVFRNVFEMRDGKIRKLTSNLIEARG